MKNKLVLGFIITVIMAILAACSGHTAQSSSINNTSSNPGSAGNRSNGNSTIESRLAPGILMLEGTPQAVTPQQAKQLLPLWQEIQTMETSGTASNSDFQGAYQQIESILTSDQIKAIQNMSFNQSEIQSLLTKLGIQVTPGSFFNGSRPTLSADERATLTAEGTQVPGGNQGRLFNGTGTPPAFTPGSNGGRSFAGNGTPNAPGQFSNRGGGSFIYVAPLIQFLQQRAGS